MGWGGAVKRDMTDVRFTFECMQHHEPLSDVDGPPFLIDLYGPDGNANPLIDRDAKPNGEWVVDLSNATCPKMAHDDSRDGGPDWCVDRWRVWATLP